MSTRGRILSITLTREFVGPGERAARHEGYAERLLTLLVALDAPTEGLDPPPDDWPRPSRAAPSQPPSSDERESSAGDGSACVI